MITTARSHITTIYHEFPRQFWVIVGVSFIDRVGGTMLFPFFSLYITQRFGVGMTQAGVILGLFAFFGLIGGMIGGALTDRFGRRSLILFGLVFSALSTLALGFVGDFVLLYPLAAVIGLLSDVAGPAHQAMIADILPEQKRTEGFGVLRVVGNLAWLVGPTIGGFVANRSYLTLFITDALISCVVALLFYRFIAESRPQAGAEAADEGIGQVFAGYVQVLADRAFMAYILATILMSIVYQQMYNTLSVYLRDVHGVSPQGYGFLLTTSAIIVILFQFWTTRRIRNAPPFLMMALGALFYLVGFTLFGVVAVYALFALNIVIITIGEMIIMPVSQALAAHFAPAEMRGRYMAMFGLSWMLPATLGPGAAGVILDNYNPNLLWYLGGVLCGLSVLGYLALHRRIGRQPRFQPAAPG
ncbi:MAG: MFS transporter [Caldilineales bacterium]|nr:MFS transporter [Caldilineales bacterium]